MARRGGSTYAKGKGHFAHAGGLLSRRISQAGSGRGFAQTRLLTQWSEIVGKDIAAICRPSKVSFPRNGIGGTLVLLTNGARAPELQLQADLIQQRVNAVYGYNAITRIRVTQTDTASSGFAEARKPFAQITTEPKPVSTENLGLEDVKDDGLRHALESLGRHVLRKS